MPKRSSNKKDLNTRAHSIVQRVTGSSIVPEKEKNPAAVALGRLGGLKGGKSRASKLTKEQRSEIARKAANLRWNNKP